MWGMEMREEMTNHIFNATFFLCLCSGHHLNHLLYYWIKVNYIFRMNAKCNNLRIKLSVTTDVFSNTGLKNKHSYRTFYQRFSAATALWYQNMSCLFSCICTYIVTTISAHDTSWCIWKKRFLKTFYSADLRKPQSQGIRSSSIIYCSGINLNNKNCFAE